MSVIVTLETMNLLTKPLVKNIFTFILRSGVVSRYKLQEKEKAPEPEVESALDDLVSAGLVGSSSASIRDFDKFYHTGSGLAAQTLVK